MSDHDASGLVAGVDEVGRGPLAGPVVAAAVILDRNKMPAGLADSKKLSEKKRQLLAQQIKQMAISWSIAEVPPKKIDELNILQASLLAMKIAVEQLETQPGYCLIDGNRCPELKMPCEAIVKGDQKEPAISAASIIAKVYRDELMIQMAQTYPEYGFEKHKGYPTKLHMMAIKEFGVTEIHRQSFGPVQQQPDF